MYVASFFHLHLQVQLQTGSSTATRQHHQHHQHHQQRPAPQQVPSGPLKPEQVAKLLSELDVVRRNLDVMNEILTETEPGKGTPDDMQLLDVSNK